MWCVGEDGGSAPPNCSSAKMNFEPVRMILDLDYANNSAAAHASHHCPSGAVRFLVRRPHRRPLLIRNQHPNVSPPLPPTPPHSLLPDPQPILCITKHSGLNSSTRSSSASSGKAPPPPPVHPPFISVHSCPWHNLFLRRPLFLYPLARYIFGFAVSSIANKLISAPKPNSA
jgi:hypothetical protein